MDLNYILGFIILGIIFFLVAFLFIKKKNNTKEIEPHQFQQKETIIPLREKEFVVIEEYQFTLEGTLEGAKRTSRNRQMLLMDMNSYSEVTLKVEKRGNINSIIVLNENEYDIGILKKEDQEKIINYLENLDYKIESGVEKFIRTSEGESLIIYVTVFEYK